MRIEDAASEYASGKLNITLPKNSEHEELDLTIIPHVEDKNKLMAINRRMMDKNAEDRDLSEQEKIIQGIVDRSYPHLPEGSRQGICMKHSHEILLELYFIWGWQSRDAFNAQKDAQKKVLESLSNGDIEDIKSLLNPATQNQ